MDPTSWLFGTMAFPKREDGQPSQSPIMPGGILFIRLTTSDGPCLISLYDISAIFTREGGERSFISYRTGSGVTVRESVAQIAEQINRVAANPSPPPSAERAEQ